MEDTNLAQQTAKEFWTSRKEYPSFGSKKRRFHEIEYLAPKLLGCKTLVDIGCGDGSQLLLLKQLTNIKTFYGLDLSENLLKQLNKKDPNIGTFIYDFYDKDAYIPESDVTLLSGSIQYIMDNGTLQNVLNKIIADKIIIRTSCTNEPEDLIINHYSEELKANYASRYMTLANTLQQIGMQFKITDVKRVYPNELDSKFNSYQWWIIAEL